MSDQDGSYLILVNRPKNNENFSDAPNYMNDGFVTIFSVKCTYNLGFI